MFLSTIEFVCGLLIGLVVGHLLHTASCPANENTQMTLKIYGKILKNSLIRNLSWTRTFHLPKWLLKSASYAGGKGIANSTLNNFYQRKTNPRKITVEAVQEWVDKEKGKEN